MNDVSQLIVEDEESNFRYAVLGFFAHIVYLRCVQKTALVAGKNEEVAAWIARGTGLGSLALAGLFYFNQTYSRLQFKNTTEGATPVANLLIGAMLGHQAYDLFWLFPILPTTDRSVWAHHIAFPLLAAYPVYKQRFMPCLAAGTASELIGLSQCFTAYSKSVQKYPVLARMLALSTLLARNYYFNYYHVMTVWGMRRQMNVRPDEPLFQRWMQTILATLVGLDLLWLVLSVKGSFRFLLQVNQRQTKLKSNKLM